MKLETVAGLMKHQGPFLSAYVDVSRDTADAPHRIELAWRAAREQLTDDGAPADLVEQVEERVLRPTSAPGQVSRMVLAAGGDVLVDEDVRRSDSSDVVTWGPLPDVTRWLADQDTMIPVLLVLADREGADLELYDCWPGRPVGEDAVEGQALHINKVRGGDEANKQYQRRTEEVWRRNAEDVASEVEELAARGVRLVALAGDVRAVGEIRDVLSEPTAAKVVMLEEGSRSDGSSREVVDDAVDQAVRDVVVQEHVATVRELDEGTGQRGDTVHGLPDVIESLVQGKVRTLVMSPEIASQHAVAPAEYPGLALPQSALEQSRLRADLAAICVAAATDAELVVLGPASLPQDGLAALLRWT